MRRSWRRGRYKIQHATYSNHSDDLFVYMPAGRCRHKLSSRDESGDTNIQNEEYICKSYIGYGLCFLSSCPW